MRMDPRGLMTKVRERISREENGVERENGREGGGLAAAGRQALGTVFKFRGAAGRIGTGLGTVARVTRVGDRRRDSRLFRQLPPQLQETARAQDHVWEYLNGLAIEEIGVPEYHARLTPNLRDLEYRNLIYPVGKGVYIHVYPDAKDSRDYYIPIEPSLAPTCRSRWKRLTGT